MKYESYRKDVEQKLKEQQEQAVEAIGQLVTGDAVQKSPVDTGNLKASNDYYTSGSVVTIGNTAHYAPFLEKGTRRMSAQPFLYPAVTENRNNIVQLVEQYVKG